MTTPNFHSLAWELAERQHGVVARRQLLALGFTREAIEQRIRKGRLHPLYRGVYAVGRPELTQHGRWMAAILAKGPAAVLSHRSAASLYGVALQKGNAIHVAVPAHSRRSSSRGITVHRRNELQRDDTPGHPGHTHRQTPSSTSRPRRRATSSSRPSTRPTSATSSTRGAARSGRAHEASRRGQGGAVLDHHTRTDSPLEREFLQASPNEQASPHRRPKPTSTATASTSTGPSSTSSSKPTASATTAPRPRRPPTASATRTTSSPA